MNDREWLHQSLSSIKKVNYEFLHNRLGERITIPVLRFLNRLGILRKFRPLPTAELAGKMAKVAKVLGSGKHVMELNKI